MPLDIKSQLTETHCKELLKNPKKNPLTGYPIDPSAPHGVYKKLEKLCKEKFGLSSTKSKSGSPTKGKTVIRAYIAGFVTKGSMLKRRSYHELPEPMQKQLADAVRKEIKRDNKNDPLGLVFGDYGEGRFLDARDLDHDEYLFSPSIRKIIPVLQVSQKKGCCPTIEYQFPVDLPDHGWSDYVKDWADFDDFESLIEVGDDEEYYAYPQAFIWENHGGWFYLDEDKEYQIPPNCKEYEDAVIKYVTKGDKDAKNEVLRMTRKYK